MNWKELLQSKKFKVLMVTATGLILMSLAQNGTITSDVLQDVINVVLVYLGAQGLADFGKYRQ